MKRLTILYDARCGFCRRIRHWLARQPAFVPLVFVPFQSAGYLFPGIEALQPEEQLLVISDTGGIWKGASAWIMVLWALQETRGWAIELASPALRPFARVVCELVSQNRFTLSHWFGTKSEEDLRQQLEKEERTSAALPGEKCSVAAGDVRERK